MNAYKYDDDFIYTGIVDCVEASPPDVGWYLPAQSTDVAPPTDEQGQWIFDGHVWTELAIEKKAGLIRQQRDALLSATDYMMMPDYPMSELARENLKVYRQALRDVPEQPGFPNSVVWPIKGE